MPKIRIKKFIFKGNWIEPVKRIWKPKKSYPVGLGTEQQLESALVFPAGPRQPCHQGWTVELDALAQGGFCCSAIQLNSVLAYY